MFQDNLNILAFTKSEKKINFKILGKSFETTNDNILVYNKGDFFIKPKNEIGDGQYIVFVFDRDEIFFEELDKDAFLGGVGFFKQFDEQSGQTKTYLYKYPKDRLDFCNKILSKIGIDGVKAVVDGRFVVLSHQVGKSSSQIEVPLLSPFNFGLLANLSVLFGLCFVYGNIDVSNNTINSIKIHVPIALGDFQKKEFLDKIVEFLFENGLFVITNFLENKFGYTYQITINDWEILDIFMFWFNKYQIFKISENPKKDKMTNIKERLYKEFSFDKNFLLKMVEK